MNQTDVKKAEGKLGILVVGLGAVSSTFITGVLMARKGLAKPVGSMTQYDIMRVGEGADKKYLHYNQIVPIADPQRHRIRLLGRISRQRFRIGHERRGSQGKRYPSRKGRA